MLWRFDPPYPSFALVMDKLESQTFDPSRLPSYRSSFLDRFHPYPRPPGQRAEEIFMVRLRVSPSCYPPVTKTTVLRVIAATTVLSV